MLRNNKSAMLPLLGAWLPSVTPPQPQTRTLMARPTLPATERRRLTVAGLRVTEDEHAEILERARVAGLRPASYLRRAALSRHVQPPPAIPEINQHGIGELNRLGNLLNQVTVYLHQGQAHTVPMDLVRDLYDLLIVIRRQLAGQAAT